MTRTFILLVLSVSILAPAMLVCQPRSLGSGSDPAFSPDAKRVAYKLGNSLAVVGRDGKNAKRVGRLVWDDEPSWSPDGRQIAFQSYGPTWGKNRIGKFAIWIICWDGTNPRRLIEPVSGGDQFPRWSPNGRQISWTHGNQLWIADASGSNAHPLTSQPAGIWEHMGDWSPDGKTIVYIRQDSYGADSRIWLIDADGKNQRLLVANTYACAAKWSRKSGFIFYTDETRLFKVKPDGSDRILVCSFNTPYQVFQFDISFDERLAVYSVGGAEVDEEVFIIDLPQASE
jgi:Tol biopolymer transport system component